MAVAGGHVHSPYDGNECDAVSAGHFERSTKHERGTMADQEYEQLNVAVSEGDMQRVRQFLKEGLNPNGPDDAPHYARPLNGALVAKQFEIAETLFEAGALPRYAADMLGTYLEEPAAYAVWIERIIADPDPRFSKDYQSAFTEAVGKGQRELAEKLWSVCPSPAEFESRRTPLCEAIRNANEPMALWMLELGFDHTTCGQYETAPAILAVLADCPETLSRLFELGESAERRVHGHQTVLLPGLPLYTKLRHIREYPKNNKFEIFHDGSLLHAAAVAGSARCAQVLLEAGLDPEEPDSEGRTPAMLAAIGGQATRDVLNLLPEPDLSSGPALNDLMLRSILDGDADGVQQAIDRGADLSATIRPAQFLEETPFLGEATPLIFAAARGEIEILKRLIEAGADLEQDDWPAGGKRDPSVQQFQIENAGFETMLSMPMKAGRTPLGWAALAGEAESMRTLIQAGAHTESVDVLGFGLLHLAAMSDKPAALEVALETGVDLHAEAMEGMTPLHAAAATNGGKVIDMLIEAGASTTRYSKIGETPYVTAKECGKPRAYRRLEPHTPKEFQKKKRKSKAVPEWEWSRDEFQALLKRVNQSHGKEARSLTTKKFRTQLAKAAREEQFRETAEQVRKKLKGNELNSWEDSPHLVWFECGKPTDARLLKVQQEFLSQNVFLVRQLSSTGDSWRVFVVPTGNVFEMLGAFGINGVNMGLDPAPTIAWLMNLHERHPFQVIAIMHDGIEFRFDQPIAEPDRLVQELMTACPPPMDEGKELLRLRKVLKGKKPQVFLWWD